MPLTLDDLFASPDHYLHSFDFSASGGDQAIFVPMDRAAYHRSIFLDGRISPAAEGSMALPVKTVLQGTRPAAATAWIFHMAHVGSTLLARALDASDASLVLREPLALRQCAIHPDGRRLALVLAMLGKRYRADAPTLVKANVPVNFLLPGIAATDSEARAILLYLPLRDYLLAILRNGDHRTWLRNLTGQLSQHLGDLSALSDAERAAALWLAQARAFGGALAAMPNARALNAERFFAAPETVLNAAAAHLGVPIAPAEIAATVAGPLFSTYSKNPSLAFDNAARVTRRQALEQEIAAELDAAEAWIAHNASDDPETPLVAGALIR
jgi:hypothetical protein